MLCPLTLMNNSIIEKQEDTMIKNIRAFIYTGTKSGPRRLML